MELIDFHAHILPGIDDGAANIEESRKLLIAQKEQGIQTVVATPHYLKYSSSITRFLRNREAALSLVKEQITEDIPQIVLGAEVELYYGLSKKDNLQRLCIEGTSYMLVEPPMEYWTEWVYEELYRIQAIHNIKPIIAHLDRYIIDSKSFRIVDRLMQSDVLAQVNAGSLLSFFSRTYAKELWKRNMFTILGSDCHDNESRSCKLAKAYRIFEKKFGRDALCQLMENGQKILQNQPIVRE